MIDDIVRSNFIAPDNSNYDDVKIVLDKIINQLIEFLSNANNYPPLPVFEKLSNELFKIPNNAQSLDSIQNRLADVYKYSMNPANKNYIGHMDSIANIYSILGEMIASAINNNMLSLEMSPFLTQLEYGLIREFSQLFGLPNSSGGVMVSGGSLANLQALIVARNIALDLHNGDLVSCTQIPVIFTSEVSHASIVKAAMLMGIGAANVIKVNCNTNYQMCTDDLEFKISESIIKGYKPIAIVATAGTTVTGSIDSLNEIAQIANKYNVWFHVDAIYGGALKFSSTRKYLLSGIEYADSISFNPQKWLYVAKTSSMVLFRDFSQMVNNFRIAAPYMKEQEDFINLGEITIQGSHHAEVLKLWLSLFAIGKDGYQQLIDYGYELTEITLQHLGNRAYLELIMKPQTNIVVFRMNYVNTNIDALNSELQEYLLKHGFFVSIPKFQGSLWLRMVLMNPFTDKDVINKFFMTIDSFYDLVKMR